MKTAILGGGGFLGSHITDALISAGHQVTVFDLPEAQYLKYCDEKGANIITGNFLNIDSVRDAIADVDIIYYLISTTVPQTSNENPQFDIKTNVIGLINILDEARRLGTKKIIFTSSGGTVYGIPREVPIKETHSTNPICSYGIHKLTNEKFLHLYWSLHNLDYCILRIANAYGERQPTGGSQGVIGAFLSKAIHNKEIVIWGDGSIIRDFVYARDIANAVLLASQYQGKPKIFNVGSGKGHSLNEVADTISRIINRPLGIKYMPERPFDVPSNVLDITRAKINMGWEPSTDLSEGILNTYYSMK